jgi:hypothetical protein
MHRLIQLQHDVISRVDHVVDCSNTNSLQAPHQPGGRVRDLDAPEYRAEEPGTSLRILGSCPHPSNHTGLTQPADRRHIDQGRRRDGRKPERDSIRGGKLPGNALVTQQVGSVRPYVYNQTVIIHRDDVQQSGTGSSIGLELPDAITILAQAQLPRRAEHTLGALTPELALLDAKAAWERGADRRKGVLATGRDVRGAADHVLPFRRPAVHDAHPQPIRIGMGPHLLHQSDEDVGQLPM